MKNFTRKRDNTINIYNIDLTIGINFVMKIDVLSIYLSIYIY